MYVRVYMYVCMCVCSMTVSMRNVFCSVKASAEYASVNTLLSIKWLLLYIIQSLVRFKWRSYLQSRMKTSGQQCLRMKAGGGGGRWEVGGMVIAPFPHSKLA